MSSSNTVTPSTSTKSLLCVITTLALVVTYYCMEKNLNLRELGTDALTNTNILYGIRPNKAGPYPQRVAPLDSTDKFSFVHISKCAGSTWIRLFKEILKLNICPEREAGAEHSVSYQQQRKCKDADHTLISLRSPRHHVWSQFTMYKYSSWGKNITLLEDFPRSGDNYKDDEVDFDSWLYHFVSMGNETNNHFYKTAIIQPISKLEH